MSKRENMTLIIEKYLDGYKGQTVELTSKEVRDMPEIDAYCENTSYANVCSAMRKVSNALYHPEIVGGKDQSSTYKVKYSVK